MAGELWRATAEIGKETTYGTRVAATRKVYLRDPVGTREREPRPHMFAVGTRDNVRAFTLGPQVVGGSMSMAMSTDEMVEWLLATLAGAVTPSVVETTGRLWTFTPGNTLDSITLRYNDGARPWAVGGLYVDEMRIAGNVRSENVATFNFFGKEMVQEALTGGLTDRVPRFHEGWETKFYLDAHAGTPGATNIAGALISWDIAFRNNLARKYFADNTNATGAVTIGELGVEATLLVEASPAIALTEFNNWDAATKRLMRLEFGNNENISGTSTPLKYLVWLDIPAAWSAVDLGQTDENTRAYQFSAQYVYDPTNAFGFRAIARNARATAFA